MAMVTFLSLAAYPTRKAYGVTIKFTMSALEEIGIRTSLISINNLNPKRFLGRFVSCLISFFRLFFRLDFSPLGKYAFSINRLLFDLYLFLELKNSDLYTFWIRDIRLAGFLQKHFENCLIVLEVHQFPNVSEVRILQQLGNRVLVCPISEATLREINGLAMKSRVVLLPMGVPENFYSEASTTSKPEFQAGYFGSFFNSGRDQGVSSMIQSFIPYLNENSSAKLLLAGIGVQGVAFLDKLPISLDVRKRIIAHTHVDHSQVAALMGQCSVLVLPYPEGEFFAARFPIKAMEYAGVGRSVLCTKTTSHTSIFTEDEAWFYSLDDEGDLIVKLKTIFANEAQAKRKIRNAHNKSLSHSYSSRISRVIDFLP